MSRGLYISAGGHGLLILWALFGGLLRSDPPEVRISEVTVLSEAEFAALSPTAQAPQPTPEPAPQQPVPPPDPEPEPTRPTPEPDPQPTPEPQPAPPPEPAPEPLPETPAPPPQAQVSDTPPELAPAPEPEPTPQPVVTAEPTPAPSSAPVRSLRPKPRPAPRVAPTPAPPPPRDAVIAEESQRAASPDADSPDVAEEAREETAPEETAPEIVTEAEQPAAPTRSLRPVARPQRLAAAANPPAATPPANADPATADTPRPATDDALAAALAEALSADNAAPEPSGPPLSRGEQDAFRLAVQSCWIVDVGSQAANVSVTIGFELDRDGRVLPDTVRMVAASGGSDTAVRTAFHKARIAVLRCQNSGGGGGYNLPAEKYEQWKEVEMVFDPSDMRLR